MPNERQGFRLHRFEVLNWGTFDRHVWAIAPEGENALLTGDIGSGKSTLVDALTTLLVPPQKIVYNRAAGAEGKERTLASYVRGDYKSAKDDGALKAKTVALRDHSRHTVILGLFKNDALDEWMAAGQVFWLKPGQSTPDRHYFIADRPLTVAEDFSGFGKEIGALKKRLRKSPGVSDFDTFVGYAGELRRRLGIESEQALTLFYQTVSLKAVGNLTDFVREHMLDAPNVKERIEALCREFHNLNQAHEAVVRAWRQVEMLTPLVAACDELDALRASARRLVECRGVLHAHFEAQRAELLVERIARRREEMDKLEDRMRLAKGRVEELSHQNADVLRAIDDQGGRRLADIAREVENLTAERVRRQDQAKAHERLCQALKLDPATDEASFHSTRAAAQARERAQEVARAELEGRQVDLAVKRDGMRKAHAELESELASLRSRKSNIEARVLSIRTRICDALGIASDDLPFAGELMQVRPDESRWEGAIERVLRGFAQSLLVSAEHYDKVAAFVDDTDLRGRLVYFRVPAQVRLSQRTTTPDSLVRKLELKPEGDLAVWLENELAEHFDYACCEDLETFKRRPRALTVNGQVKSGRDKHEKDDRNRLDDRSRYVLGWTNEAKIRLLEEREAGMYAEMTALIGRMQQLDGERRALQAERDKLLELLRFQRFSVLAWQPVAGQIQALLDEKKNIEQSSDALRELQAKLEQLGRDLENATTELEQRRDELAAVKNKLAGEEAGLEAAHAVVGAVSEETRRDLFAVLAAMQPEALAGREVTIEGCAPREREMRDWLQARIDAEEKRAGRLSEGIVERMAAYRTAFPVETRDADARPEAAGEYRGMLQKLVDEDLPRHEERFKKMLNEGTINNVALLRSQLESERDAIEQKLRTINASLTAIEYQAGTYIVLVSEPTGDAEIRQFQADLRACLGDTFAAGQDELYTEGKFQQVKALVDRFVGREGRTELDRRWSEKVADVRNWFLFSASERWRHDDTEREHYSDSAGKSGGQKEKLAYTILASALVYQFGLERTGERPRAFRFVMIDEAFGRGSDESARYALDLFEEFGLQLLIVTPLQKIHVIEDYVRTVNFVHNDGGKQSKVRNLSIEEYRAEKAAYHARHGIVLDNAR